MWWWRDEGEEGGRRTSLLNTYRRRKPRSSQWPTGDAESEKRTNESSRPSGRERGGQGGARDRQHGSHLSNNLRPKTTQEQEPAQHGEHEDAIRNAENSRLRSSTTLSPTSPRVSTRMGRRQKSAADLRRPPTPVGRGTRTPRGLVS
jgi:hypothetical protein